MFRKFSADQLFTGYTMLGPDAVLITDENGVVEDIIDKAKAGGDVETIQGHNFTGLYQLSLPS